MLPALAPKYFESAKPLAGQPFDMVLVAARGSSDNAALYARYLIEIRLGIPVSLAAPSVLTRYERRVKYTRCLAVGISQSGAAPDVAEVLASLRNDGHTTLGITNTPRSRLTDSTDHSILLEVGQERSVAATKTYSASLLAIYQLVRALGGALPDPVGLLPNRSWCDTCLGEAVDQVGVVVRSNPVIALARGYGYCTAQETALKLMECALIPCKSYSAADFQHGPKALAGHGSVVIDFGRSARELASQGCSLVEAPAPPLDHGHEALAPIWDIVFGQWLALLAARNRGLDPDDPRYIQKVTETL